jgi:glycerate 2-kinase
MSLPKMRILIAPDKFKGSLSAREVAENIAAGLREVLPEAKIDIVPMADGGEGTADVIGEALGGSWLKCNAHDPLEREIQARYAWVEDQKLAVMEMSEAAGMRRLPENERDPLRANTFGVGEMLLDAAKRGAGEIIIGLGGSATNDGGFGMARAAGFRFFGDTEFRLSATPHLNPLPLRRGEGRVRSREFEATERVSELLQLTRIEQPKNLSLPKIIAAVDVRNPLLGDNGATHVFGPQKGAAPDKIDKLERALTRLADVVANDLGVDYRSEPGAGAAGGLGFGLMSFCGAKIRPGFDVVAEAVGLESKMKDVDVVITGEGSLDRQTLEGKTPAGVARLARKLDKRVYAVVGRASDDREAREIFAGVYELGGSIPQARELLRERARELGKIL